MLLQICPENTVLQPMSRNYHRKVTSQGSLTGALDSQNMLNTFCFP